MQTRRKFLKVSALGAGAIVATSACAAPEESPTQDETENAPIPSAPTKPIVVSTWNHGTAANAGAWSILGEQGSALDAVEQGVRVTESDPKNSSVGLGGLPDRDGHVTLDACIMNAEGDCGAVAFLQNIENPISVARKVMEDTPHVMLVGEGAKRFAVDKGFEETNLLTASSEEAWMKWMEEQKYTPPPINHENHDTIGMLALDAEGNLSGACTTSGAAYKLHGRVGDSPIIGAGLFVDNEVGAACATGLGEAVIRIAGSHLVVELMRQGHSPNDACRMAVERLMSKHKNLEGLQVGFLALNKQGEAGGYSVYYGFNYALRTAEKDELIDAGYKLEW